MLRDLVLLKDKSRTLAGVRELGRRNPMRSQPLPRYSPGRTCGRSRSHNPRSRGVFRRLQERCGNRIREKNACWWPTQPRAHHTGNPRPVKKLKSQSQTPTEIASDWLLQVVEYASDDGLLARDPRCRRRNFTPSDLHMVASLSLDFQVRHFFSLVLAECDAIVCSICTDKEEYAGFSRRIGSRSFKNLGVKLT